MENNKELMALNKLIDKAVNYAQYNNYNSFSTGNLLEAMIEVIHVFNKEYEWLIGTTEHGDIYFVERSK